MNTGSRKLVAAVGAIAVLALGQVASSQAPQPSDYVGYGLRYSSGQAVQPIFEGWSKNPDGSFLMHFGYLNRNYVEEVNVPLGPQNSIEPGGPDQGQPTYFYPRINRRQFAVTVPKDFGKKELVWMINFRGKNTKAVGWLQPEWEVNSSGGAGRAEKPDENKPPTLTFESAAVRGVLPEPVTLTGSFADDGLPKPSTRKTEGGGRKQPVGQETPPILQPSESTVEAPVNLPELPLGLRGARVGPRPPPGPSVRYTIWRGPAAIQYDPMFAVPKDGKVTTKMTFAEPGEYVLKARATDGAAASTQEVKITVAAAAAPQR
jgi:hypothetical protein